MSKGSDEASPPEGPGDSRHRDRYRYRERHREASARKRPLPLSKRPRRDVVSDTATHPREWGAAADRPACRCSRHRSLDTGRSERPPRARGGASLRPGRAVTRPPGRGWRRRALYDSGGVLGAPGETTARDHRQRQRRSPTQPPHPLAWMTGKREAHEPDRPPARDRSHHPRPAPGLTWGRQYRSAGRMAASGASPQRPRDRLRPPPTPRLPDVPKKGHP